MMIESERNGAEWGWRRIERERWSAKHVVVQEWRKKRTRMRNTRVGGKEIGGCIWHRVNASKDSQQKAIGKLGRAKCSVRCGCG